MRRSRPRVLVVGSFAAEGVPCGVTSAVDGLLASPLANLYELERVSTRNDVARDRGLLPRLVFGARLFASSFVRILRSRAELVDIHAVSGREFLKNASVMLAARLLRRPVILRIHGGDFDSALDLGVPGASWLRGQLLRIPERVVVLSNGWRERIAAIEPRAQVRVLPNSVDGEAFGRLGERRLADARDILLLGNLCERKGHFDALEAAAMVLPEAPDTSLLFAGAERDAGARVALEARIEELGLTGRVQLLGPVFDKARDEAFRSAGVLILPSHVENMPLSIMEGMAAGLPVVATRVGATPEMIEEGVDGFLIEVRDCEALAQRLRMLLAEPARRSAMGGRGRAKARERWDRRAVAQQTAALYSELL